MSQYLEQFPVLRPYTSVFQFIGIMNISEETKCLRMNLCNVTVRNLSINHLQVLFIRK